MSIQTVSIYYNNAPKIIRADEIPDVDGPMRAALFELNREIPAPKSLTLLPDRVKDLAEAKELLESAKKHSVRDKICSLLSISFAVGLLVGTILGFVANPLVGMGFLLGLLTYLLYCHMKATALGQKDKREVQQYLSMYPLGVLASPLILSHLLWTRISSLEATVALAQNDIQTQAPETIAYWSAIGSQAAKRIVIEQGRAEKSLTAMQRLSIRSPRGENDLQEYNKLLARTRIEIAKGQKLALPSLEHCL